MKINVTRILLLLAVLAFLPCLSLRAGLGPVDPLPELNQGQTWYGLALMGSLALTGLVVLLAKRPAS